MINLLLEWAPNKYLKVSIEHDVKLTGVRSTEYVTMPWLPQGFSILAWHLLAHSR